jgi:hypothetical protein
MQDLAAVVIGRIWNGLKVKKEIDWKFWNVIEECCNPEPSEASLFWASSRL